MERLVRRYRSLVLYALVSVLSTVLDTAVSWFLFSALGKNILLANTAGIILGFLLHYLLASKSVFRTEYGLAGFAVYLGTFLFGLGLANGIIACAYALARPVFAENVSFFISKGLSIVLPFFVLYYLRLTLYRRLK
jgi:putative flippase GtrA